MRVLDTLSFMGTSSTSGSEAFSVDSADVPSLGVFSFSAPIDVPAVPVGAVAGVLGRPRVLPTVARAMGVTPGVCAAAVDFVLRPARVVLGKAGPPKVGVSSSALIRPSFLPTVDLFDFVRVVRGGTESLTSIGVVLGFSTILNESTGSSSVSVSSSIGVRSMAFAVLRALLFGFSEDFEDTLAPV